jgi:hypothetical protein
VRFSRPVWERFLSSLSIHSRFPILTARFRLMIGASRKEDDMQRQEQCQAEAITIDRLKLQEGQKARRYPK